MYQLNHRKLKPSLGALNTSFGQETDLSGPSNQKTPKNTTKPQYMRDHHRLRFWQENVTISNDPNSKLLPCNSSSVSKQSA